MNTPKSKCCGTKTEPSQQFPETVICKGCRHYCTTVPEREECTCKLNEKVSACKVHNPWNPPSEKQEAEDWKKDWEGYCRTYLTRYGITDEVAILAISGNLEQVVSQTRKEVALKTVEEILNKIKEYRCHPDEKHCTCMEALKDYIVSTLKKSLNER